MAILPGSPGALLSPAPSIGRKQMRTTASGLESLLFKTHPIRSSKDDCIELGASLARDANDSCPCALMVALSRRNAEMALVSDKATFVQGDMIDNGKINLVGSG